MFTVYVLLEVTNLTKMSGQTAAASVQGVCLAQWEMFIQIEVKPYWILLVNLLPPVIPNFWHNAAVSASDPSLNEWLSR